MLKAKEEDGDASDVIQKLEHQNFQLMNEICELTKKINDSNAKSADVLQGKDEEVSTTHLLFPLLGALTLLVYIRLWRALKYRPRPTYFISVSLRKVILRCVVVERIWVPGYQYY